MTLAAKAPATGTANDGARIMLRVMDLYERAIGRRDPGGCRVIAMAYSDWLYERSDMDGLGRRLVECAETLCQASGRTLWNADLYPSTGPISDEGW